ncbi:MAG: exodeoxyribonuclease VII large subunit [Halobacteria archaeon]|nr:exodeoxyribonuclease VII large subunit [Halobacteria archaeon]
MTSLDDFIDDSDSGSDSDSDSEAPRDPETSHPDADADADDVYTVSEVTQTVKSLLESDPELSDVAVSGEVSNFHHHSSGHMYFSLKDDGSSLGCVMFRRNASSLDFDPDDGDEVIAEGRVSVYEERGEYQLYVESMSESGRGDLYEEFIRLKNKLDDEGLFDDRHKKPIPDFPNHVGVVTSDSGAAVHDILDVLGRRFPVDVTVSPAKVQGDGAAPEIRDAIEEIDSEGCDVVVVGRGGGSIEDLWAFNEEEVVRAVYGCETPVVSAVGHQVDNTLTDLVADESAATPSEAAEIAVPERRDLLGRLEETETRIESAVYSEIDSYHRRLDTYERLLDRHDVVGSYSESLEELEERLEGGVEDLLEDRRDEVSRYSDLLDSLSPLNVLSRGYSVAESDGDVVTSAEDLDEGDTLEVRLSDGRVKSRVEDVCTHKRERDPEGDFV